MQSKELRYESSEGEMDSYFLERLGLKDFHLSYIAKAEATFGVQITIRLGDWMEINEEGFFPLPNSEGCANITKALIYPGDNDFSIKVVRRQIGMMILAVDKRGEPVDTVIDWMLFRDVTEAMIEAEGILERKFEMNYLGGKELYMK